jgi:cytochrome c oxidase cbb3-type subunit 3
MRYPGLVAFPAIGNPDFLAVASDRFLLATVQHGRPGRRMPAWGEAEGGLRPDEMDAVVKHVRSFGAGIAAPQESEPRRWVAGDAPAGARLYADNCASCHGPSGEAKEGPALNNRALLQHATDRYLVESIKRGRRGTSMPPFGAPGTTHRVLSDGEIEDIVTFMRTWEKPS